MINSDNDCDARAFTLLELLVVIAVIGILVGLLLPVLARAKNKASQATDLNNLKQQTAALQMFADDNNDSLPWPNWGESSRAGWLYATDTAATGTARFKLEGGLFWSTLQNPKLYWCPMERTNSDLFRQRAQQLSSYVMNGAVIGYDRMVDPPLKLSAMSPSACVFWETDETHPDYFNDGASFPEEGVSARHSQGAVQATFGGSAGYVRLKDWFRDVADPQKNRLWCYPDSPNGR